MGNREVEFDTEGSPRPAIANLCLFNGGIRVEDGLAIDFVYTRIEVAAIRQHRAFQVLILQVDGAPVMFDAAVRQVIAQSIGIIEAVCGQLIEWRIRIWQTFFVWECRCPLPDRHLGTGHGEGGQEQTSKEWSSGAHQTLIRSNRAAFS